MAVITKKKQILLFILALFSLCAAMAFTLSFSSQLPTSESWTLYNVLCELQLSLNRTVVPSSLLFLVFFLAGKHTCSKWKHPIATGALSLFISFLWLLSFAIVTAGRFNVITKTPAQIVKSVLYFFGMAYVLFLFGQLLYRVSTQRANAPAIGKPNMSAAARLYERYPFACHMLLLLLAWSPYLILDYPARISWDSWRELSMFLGHEPFAAYHPPMHTVLIGAFAVLGIALGDVNLGFFIFILLQMLIFAAMISYELELMKQLEAPKWMRTVTLLAGMFSTLFAYYSVDILKDCQYSHCFMLMTCEFMLLLRQGRQFFRSNLHCIFTVIALCGVLLFRTNGKYIVYLMLAAASIWLIVKLIQNGFPYLKSIGVKPFVVILLPLLLAEMITLGLTQHYDIGAGTVRSLFSIPFQQTARYVLSHPDDITEEEAESIRAIIDYDELPNLYDPTISDPVKNTYKSDVTVHDLLPYFKTWFKHLCRHPVTYLEATIHHTYPLYYPFAESSRTRYGTRFIRTFERLILESGYMADPIIPDGDEIADQLGQLMYRIPIIGMLSSQAFYAIVLVYLAIYGILDRKWAFLWLLAPLLLTVLVVFASPVVLNYDRYAFSYAYSSPVVLAFFNFSYRDHKN